MVSELGAKADPHRDRVTVDGAPISIRPLLYVALHKPAGFVSSRSDELGRQSVLNLLPREWSHLAPVGRLDRDSEGLLLLTNDGEFTLRATHPRYGVPKIYMAEIAGRVEARELDALKAGVTNDGELLKAVRAEIDTANHTRSLVRLVLTQGKNREVRRMFETLGREVTGLLRVQIGPIRLGQLPPGKWRVLSPTEVKSLLKMATPHSTVPLVERPRKTP